MRINSFVQRAVQRGWELRSAGRGDDHVILSLGRGIGGCVPNKVRLDPEQTGLTPTCFEITSRDGHLFGIISLAGVLNGCDSHCVEEFALSWNDSPLRWLFISERFTDGLDPRELSFCAEFDSCGAQPIASAEPAGDPIDEWLSQSVRRIRVPPRLAKSGLV
jgi:hypothetical protein